jgi:phosphoenolpyruvate---glycerone phosphotransferase subunit DhaL
MRESIGYDDIVRMLRSAAAQIRANHEHLSKLDSVGGDGDHGTTMVRAMGCLEKTVDAAKSGQVQGLLQDTGWAIMGVDGGATGPLLGTLFSSMSEVAGQTMGAAGVAAAFEAGLAGVQRQTKAQLGDKTLIDALVPAVNALRKAADEGLDVAAAVQCAAEAAAAGAVSTSALQARFGRARNIKEQSIGTQDPGATSISLIFKGFAEALAEK